MTKFNLNNCFRLFTNLIKKRKQFGMNQQLWWCWVKFSNKVTTLVPVFPRRFWLFKKRKISSFILNACSSNCFSYFNWGAVKIVSTISMKFPAQHFRVKTMPKLRNNVQQEHTFFSLSLFLPCKAKKKVNYKLHHQF